MNFYSLTLCTKVLYRSLLFIAQVLGAIALAVFANLFCWLIALAVDKQNGMLPVWLRWFQTPDASCYDEQWVAEHPDWSKYKIALTWIARNPAYGFRKWCQTDVHVLQYKAGNVFIGDGEHGLAGWYFLLAPNGAWNFCFVVDLHNGSCFRGNWGWYLLPIAKGYDSVNTGMLEADLFRFYDFGRKGN